MAPKHRARTIRPVEQLEPRTMMSNNPYHPLIAAGSATGSPADSPALRVDPNTTTSPFAGVGSLEMVTKKGAGSCTATPIAEQFVLTAAHCVDLNDDGRSTKQDRLLSVTFILNFGSDSSHLIAVSSVHIHPDYTGFNRPSVNDDIAILSLSSPLPAGVPIYDLHYGVMDQTIVLVGYGRSGDGDTGYYIDASNTVKRVGENYPDSISGQDDYFRAAADEVFTYDFDGPTGTGPLGGSTLGNGREATAGPGDSGGPSFVLVGGDPNAASSYALVGVNTFVMDNGSIAAPRFGSMAGGVIVAAYQSWIEAVLSGKKFNPGSLGGGGGGRGGFFRAPPFYHSPASDWVGRHEATISSLPAAPASFNSITVAASHDTEERATTESKLDQPLDHPPGGGDIIIHVSLVDLVLSADELTDVLTEVCGAGVPPRS